MKALLIAVLILFSAHSASVAAERDSGTRQWLGGEHGVSGQPRGSGGNWHRNDDIAGRIIGGFLGGLVGSILSPEPEPPAVVIVHPPAPEVAPGPAPWTQEWFAYCTSRYKSFVTETGRFTGYDGIEYFCR